MKTRRKWNVHSLTPQSKSNRKTNCRKLYERHLARNKYEYLVSLDEACIYTNNCNGERKVFYEKQGETASENWLKKVGATWPEKFMVIGVVTGRGPIPLFRVPERVKINSDYKVDYVLKSLLETYLPENYPDELNKIIFHHPQGPCPHLPKNRGFF